MSSCKGSKAGPLAVSTGFATLHDLEGEKVRPQNRAGPGALGVAMDAVPAGSDPVVTPLTGS